MTSYRRLEQALFNTSFTTSLLQKRNGLNLGENFFMLTMNSQSLGQKLTTKTILLSIIKRRLILVELTDIVCYYIGWPN